MDTSFEIIQIGCGGTGSYLVAPLSRFVGSVKKTGTSIRYCLIDDDTVEEKNIMRQNFSSSDVGNLKVVAMFERYGNEEEIDEIFSERCNDKFLKEVFLENVSDENKVIIFVGCVDNVESRLQVYRSIVGALDSTCNTEDGVKTDIFYVDAGNHTPERRIS